MSRHNRREDSAWSTKLVGGDSGPPRGLRGRAIGLYYRDMKMRERRERLADREKELTLTFEIPRSVENRVSNNLQNLYKQADRLDIVLPSTVDIDALFKKETASAKSMIETASAKPKIELASAKPKIESASAKSKIETASAKPKIETASAKPKIETASAKPKIETIEIISDSDSDETDTSSQINTEKSSALNSSLDSIEEVHVFKKQRTDTEDYQTYVKPYSSMSLDSNENMHEFRDIYFKKPEPVTLRAGSTPKPGPSSEQDFIPIRHENPRDISSDEHIRALRVSRSADYKYSYEDIITGSFDEKLDECLVKGVDINFQNADTNDLNIALYEDYMQMQQSRTYRKMLEFRKTLPAYKKADLVLEIIEKNQVVVISGETGCGKSTQVPQIILDKAIRNNKGANVHILVTQPRRIAASSLANRVAQERGEPTGKSVGYAVRLEKVDARPRGSIMYCTTGVLLADLEINQGLTSCSHIILDEVHERDSHIDLSMCMLKKLLQKRKDLKLLLMSATVDAETLSEYFNQCPLVHIEGLAYPVQDIYLEDILLRIGYELPPLQMGNRPPQRKRNAKIQFDKRQGQMMEKQIQYNAELGKWLEPLLRRRPEMRRIRHVLRDQRIEELNMNLIFELLLFLSVGPPGAILVFLPGIGDITKLMKIMNQSRRFTNSTCEIYPLHSKLPSLEQHKIFERPPDHIRKIIIATNIAETSITIDDIVYVVDCARIKISGLIVEENVSTLKTEWVSQTNLHQRRGRAGRCQPGVCYHLLTSYRASTIPDRLLPELQRSDLLEPVLSTKRLRLGNAVEAMAMMPSPPAQSTVEWAVKHLQQCGALNKKEILTPLGWHLARLPVHPSAGKLLLLGSLFGCLDRAASVAAVWGFKDPFQLVIGKEHLVDEAKRNFASGEPSDHVAMAEAILQWERCPMHKRRDFSYAHFLSNNTVELLSEMKNQLGDGLKNMGFLPSGDVKARWQNRNSGNISLFKAIIAASLYPKIATVRWTNPKINKRNKQPRIMVSLPEKQKKVSVHPSSVMTTGHNPVSETIKVCNDSNANWLVYWLMQRSSDLFLIDVTLVYTLPVLFFGELTFRAAEDEQDKDMCVLSISSVKVKCYKRTAKMLLELRALLDQVLASKVSCRRTAKNSEFEESVLNVVIELITAEDERSEFKGVDYQSESDGSERE